MSRDSTWEAAELAKHPGLRDRVAALAEFAEWRADLPAFELDGRTYYLPWGDVPMDEDQIIYHWAHKRGLI